MKTRNEDKGYASHIETLRNLYSLAEKKVPGFNSNRPTGTANLENSLKENGFEAELERFVENYSHELEQATGKKSAEARERERRIREEESEREHKRLEDEVRVYGYIRDSNYGGGPW